MEHFRNPGSENGATFCSAGRFKTSQSSVAAIAKEKRKSIVVD